MTNTKTRTRTEIINDIISYFDKDPDAFESCIEELDGWNGYLGDDKYYFMDELGEFFDIANENPVDFLLRAYYGWDEGNYTIDQYGREHHEPFCPNRDYFRFNGYGNLVSADFKDYSSHNDHWAVEEMAQNRAYIYSIDDYEDLTALFDELETVEGEE